MLVRLGKGCVKAHSYLPLLVHQLVSLLAHVLKHSLLVAPIVLLDLLDIWQIRDI